MLATKLACPFCQAVLKSAKPVPEGATLTCPQCRKPFRAGMEAVHAGPPPLLAPSHQVTARPPATLLPPAVAADPTIALPTGDQRKRLFLVLGSLAGIAVIAGILLWLLLRSGGDAEPVATGDEFVLPRAKERAERPKARPLITLTPEEEKLVKEMTDKGVAWLKKAQKADGTWAPYSGHLGSWPDGVTAMAGLTLLSCGVDPKDEAVVKAAARIRKTGPDLTRTYELALCVLFLDKLDDPGDAKLLETLVFRLISGQNIQGGWHYYCPTHSQKDQEIVLQRLLELDRQPTSLLQESVSPDQKRKRQETLQAALKGMPDHLKGMGAFSDPPEKASGFFRGGGDDNSNTQFAVLALWAAKKRSLPVDRALQLTVKRFKETQNADGSFIYSPAHASVVPEPTMTCAGLLALAVEYGVRSKEELKGSRPEDNPAIKKALDVVARSLTAPRDVKAKKGKARAAYPPLYFIWSVERVGMLFQLEKIAGKDWYRWGMDILHDHQLPDGHWAQGWHATTPVVDTCFALLFLNRVNLAEDLTDKLSEFGLGTADPGPALGPPDRKE